MYQKFSQWLEGRRDRTVRPHGIDYVNDPYRRGEPKRNDPGLTLPPDKPRGFYKHNHFQSDVRRQLVKFLKKKAKERRVQVPKNLASKILEWAQKVDPTGGSYMPWIISQIVKERLLVTQQSAALVSRVISRYMEVKPLLKDHPNPLVQELHNKFMSFSPEEIEARLSQV